MRSPRSLYDRSLPLLRQRMLGAGGDLSERQPVVSPRDDVSGAGDVDRGLVIAPLHLTAAVDLEKLRVQRTAI